MRVEACPDKRNKIVLKRKKDEEFCASGRHTPGNPWFGSGFTTQYIY
jgi:hypothetical protein